MTVTSSRITMVVGDGTAAGDTVGIAGIVGIPVGGLAGIIGTTGITAGGTGITDISGNPEERGFGPFLFASRLSLYDEYNPTKRARRTALRSFEQFPRELHCYFSASMAPTSHRSHVGFRG